MKCVSKVRFVSAQFGTTKKREDRDSQSYFLVNVVDEEQNNYKFFVFEGSDLYNKLKNTGLNFGDYLLAVVNLNPFNNVGSLVSLEVTPNGK